MDKKNLIFVIGLLLAGGLLFFVIVSAVDESVYMMQVDQAVKEQAKHEGNEIKVQGNVIPGSIKVASDNQAKFKLTKSGETIEVFYNGTRPDTFKDCADVIVTGTLDANLRFEATDMIAKCPSKYDELPGGCETQPEETKTSANTKPAKASGY